MRISYEKLWTLAKQNKMKKRDLARAAGITAYNMAKLGKSQPVQMQIMIRLCKVFHCDNTVKVVHRKDLIRTMAGICSQYPDVFSKETVGYVARQLQSFANADEKTKQKHIDDIKTKCPRCGRELVTREVKEGPRKGTRFIGCSGFPECRYTRNI